MGSRLLQLVKSTPIIFSLFFGIWRGGSHNMVQFLLSLVLTHSPQPQLMKHHFCAVVNCHWCWNVYVPRPEQMHPLKADLYKSQMSGCHGAWNFHDGGLEVPFCYVTTSEWPVKDDKINSLSLPRLSLFVSLTSSVSLSPSLLSPSLHSRPLYLSVLFTFLSLSLSRNLTAPALLSF
jgi:hypothetical protein